VLLEPYLETALRLLVRPPDPPLHLLLDPVERLPLDQGPVRPGLHVPVRTGQAAVHGVPQDVRDGLARPRPSRLRAIPEPVQLLADLCDPPPLEISAEDEPDDLRLVVVHLEGTFDVPVSERARVIQER